MDKVGARIDAARPKRQRRPVVVPDEAVDQCESGHVAGKGTNVKANAEHFDDGGVMALICRHDIPLFLVNIDTPGEQQKYPVALIEHLFTLIPDHSTVAVLYDVACVLDRSLEKVRLSHLPGTNAQNTRKVRHFVRPHSHAANLRHNCNARVWTPVGLSARIQPPYTRGFGTLGR